MKIVELDLQRIATEHAQKILGMDQFVENEDAAQSIIEDFKDGFKECLTRHEEDKPNRVKQAMELYADYGCNPEKYNNDFSCLIDKIVSL